MELGAALDELAPFKSDRTASAALSQGDSITDCRGSVRGLLHCEISPRLMTGWGQSTKSLRDSCAVRLVLSVYPQGRDGG